MDRNEAVLRELNLYPLWKRRAPAPDVVYEAESVVETAAYPINPDSSLEPAAQSLPPESGKARMGVEQRENQVSTPSLTLPLQGRGNLALNELSGKNLRGELGNLDWPELKQRVSACTACRLRAGCTQTVFGVGDAQAEWLFVGEGPGAEEDAQGEPFVGQAGKLLDNMLLAIGLGRGKNVYIANVVKCRPPDDARPKVDEIVACLPYLQRQIELIKPRIIIALGKTAATALLGQDAPLGSLRGTLHEFNGIPLIVTYHPAYLLRSPMEKAKVWQDLCLAMSMMAG